mgnify:CR=1 FL=1
MDVTIPAESRAVVKDEWIDGNDHMNSAMYLTAFRQAPGPLLHGAGLTPAFFAEQATSLVQREAHIRYVRELRRDEPILMRAWIAGVDARSVHVVAEMSHGGDGWLAASVEILYTYFDRKQRRSADWPEAVRQGLDAIWLAGANTLPAEAVGRSVAVRRE